jgi:hypothetical protein
MNEAAGSAEKPNVAPPAERPLASGPQPSTDSNIDQSKEVLLKKQESSGGSPSKKRGIKFDQEVEMVTDRKVAERRSKAQGGGGQDF